MGVGGQRHVPATLQLLPIVQGAGWAQGPVWPSAENLAPTSTGTPDHPVRNESIPQR